MKVTGTSIQQLEKDRPRARCRKWRLWVSTDEGRKSRRFAGAYKQAQGALRDFVSELEAQVPNADTFEAYAGSWHRWRVESGDFSPNTMAGEETCLNVIATSELGSMRMDEITPDDCREALLWLKGNGQKRSERKASTMGKIHQVMNQVMKQAVMEGKLARNPMDSVPRPKAKFAEREALSPAEIQLFLNRLDEMEVDGRVIALYLMACLGLRCGEACALRDSEVVGGMAHVTSTVRSADDSVGPPKSHAGVRSLPVPPRLAAKVAEWRERRERLGIADAERLCCRVDGSPISVRSLAGWWRGEDGYEGAGEKLGCYGMTLHQLRHSNLSMMSRHMSLFDLQRYAGWASIAPAKIYVHEDIDSVTRAVEMAWA